MGIPYSKEIHSAFDEVTPLVAAGFKVLRTSRNITILLAVIQLFNFFLLALSVVILGGILISVSPGLEEERRTLVTPAVRWVLNWLIDLTWLRLALGAIVIGTVVGVWAGWYVTQDMPGFDDAQGEDPGDEVEAIQDFAG